MIYLSNSLSSGKNLKTEETLSGSKQDYFKINTYEFHKSSSNNDNEEDNLEIFQYLTIFGNKIKINFFKLAQYSRYICRNFSQFNVEESLSLNIEQFLVTINQGKENIITVEHVKNFLNANQEKDFEINEQNFAQMLDLSAQYETRHFQMILDDYEKYHLKNYHFFVGYYLSRLSKLENEYINYKNNTIDLNYIETRIIDHLDESLKHPYISQLQNEVIYRILEKAKPNQIPHEALFSFIQQSIQHRFIFYYFLNLSKVSNTDQEKFLNNLKNISNDQDQERLNSFQFPTDFLLQLNSLNHDLKQIQKNNLMTISDLENKNNVKEKLFNENKETISQLENQIKEDRLIIDEMRKELENKTQQFILMENKLLHEIEKHNQNIKKAQEQIHDLTDESLQQKKIITKYDKLVKGLQNLIKNMDQENTISCFNKEEEIKKFDVLQKEIEMAKAQIGGERIMESRIPRRISNYELRLLSKRSLFQ
ncbi:hypothetical protein TRFO_42421 [Tritrichomonas foetus]|uniref:Uncharacterized protein n=1 Tax=Tritrichomonas foetus TaxID=1144522 RepID=A0A1J4L102_9EUKA|nr:hypothetical protein TRFO_42421 [Tritrichomonas foetus]|eukprot:OHT15646.1 hypothetical protein TRFO_42421 [Tritrichomonas foetus]